MDYEKLRRVAEVLLKIVAVLIVIVIVGFGLLLGICGLMFR